jgi:hypothetical protein
LKLFPFHDICADILRAIPALKDSTTAGHLFPHEPLIRVRTAPSNDITIALEI